MKRPISNPSTWLRTSLQSLLLLLLLTGCSLLPDRNDTPPLVLEPPPPNAYESLAALTQATLPARDMVALANRFQGLDLQRVAYEQPIAYAVGDSAPFWYKDLDSDENVQIDAVLLYRSDALNMWVEAGERVSNNKLLTAAEQIENEILPVNRAFFGLEWQPGIDGDNRLNILHVGKIGGVATAYYLSADEYVTAVNPYSNQRELLYVNLDKVQIGSDTYFNAIAHEIQHLIHWHTDRNEEAWLNEGLSELAVRLNGMDPNRANSYGKQPDIQLNTLNQQPDLIDNHYAAAYLFVLYFYDRFGPEATKALIQHPDNGLSSFEAILADSNIDLTTFFADWLVTNYLTGIGREHGVYQYTGETLPDIESLRIGRFPAQQTETVHQFGADFIEVHSNTPVTLVFTGTQQVKLVNTLPHNGDYFWSSLPGDESDMQLTRTVDLSLVDRATLTFWTWYEIETGWDYAYVAVSADNGRTWHLLETDSTTHDNPQGNSLGPGYTGKSGGGDEPIWVQETVDLTPYAGQTIQLRFQYITDGAVHEQGFVIDDIAIPEIGLMDGGEADDGSWLAEGIERTTAVLPQQFIVQQILVGTDTVEVTRLELDANQRGEWLLPLSKTVDTAVLIVSGRTPMTRQTAVYAYELSQE